jgi:uncharacterized repeat protein (TIGR03806 family)
VAANRAGPSSLVVAALVLLEACHSSSSDDGGAQNPPPPPGVAVGLDARPSNTTCLAPAKTPAGGTSIQVQRVFQSVALDQPLAMLQAPGDDSRWFLVEKGGTVRVFANTANPTASNFISITVNANSEGGLLGMAFHPDWLTNRQVFLSFTEGTPMVSVVARYTMSANGLTADPGTRVNVIQVPQPSGLDNHKGGHIAFGPDGFLYFALGDGGGGGDPHSTAQDTTDLLGSMLRLDVDGGAPYAIPPDNPFASGAVCDQRAHTNSANICPEIYAWGLRNPWRWSFDSASATPDLWLGDVGQGAFEEIDRVQRGGNYGWDCREGTSTFGSAAATCSTATGLIDPVHQYGRSLGFSVTGGYVYRGSAIPGLVGSYLFADYGSGRIWRLVPSGGGFASEELLDTSLAVASFGQGNDGELYVVDIAAGGVHRIAAAGGTSPSTPVPTLLSATGCVNPQNPSQAATGLVPYEPAAPFWSDNATKERWLAIPNGTSIGVGADGDFVFPSGTVLMKHFRLNNALVETRLFMRHPDGDWAGYTYEWNAQRTDATLVQGGKTVAIGGQSWIFPSSNDCLTCHTAAAGYSLSLEAAQLNRNLPYVSTGRTANQLRTLDAITMFATPLGDPALQPSMPDPFDAGAPLAQRARAYLHTNCAQCHRAGGPTPSSLDLRYSTLLPNMNACGAQPQSGDLGLGAAARIIAPGSAANSVLVARMTRRDANGMPPLASTIADQQGVALLQQWIDSLATCQ